MLLPVILSGGAGTRLWPVSSARRPKPFMPLPGGGTLLQKTYERALGLPGVRDVLTVTNLALKRPAEEIFRIAQGNGNGSVFILEPEGRNTAAAIGMAAMHVSLIYGPETILLVMPADHVIEKRDEFSKNVLTGMTLAEQGRIVAFGVAPSRPETGFGYIEASGNDVLRFVEKPSRCLAEKYMSDGNYLWNAGIFCFRADSMLEEMKKHAPEIAETALRCYKASNGPDGEKGTIVLDAALFAKIPATSIDYAVMEKTNRMAVVPCDIGWNDVGVWSAFGGMMTADADGNRVAGNAVLHEATNCIVYGGHRVAALSGVDGLVVIDAPDALLVTKQDAVQDVGRIVAKLQEQGRGAGAQVEGREYAWGRGTFLDKGVRRLEIYPGHCYEGCGPALWAVMAGACRMESDDRNARLERGGHRFMEEAFRIENDAQETLIAVEIALLAWK